MKTLFNGMAEFVDKTFPNATAADHLTKLKKEAEEAINEPDDLEEYADCLLCLFGAVHKAGYNLEVLFIAASGKLLEIKNRKWEKLPDGTYQHIKQ